MEYYSAKNSNKHLPLVATLIDLKGIKLVKLDGERQTLMLSFMWNLNNKTSE